MNVDPPPGSRSVRATAVVPLLIALVAVGVVATPAAAVPTPVDSCGSIGSPGTYVLTAGIADYNNGTCLRIEAGDVVLDGQGRTIDGVDRPGSVGVLVTETVPDRNVTVKDLTVRDFEAGVSVGPNASGTLVRGVTVRDLDTAGFNRTRGIEVLRSDGVGIEASTVVESPGRGILIDGNGSAVLDSRVRESGTGIRVNTLIRDTLVRNATVVDSDDDGIRLDGTNDTRVLDSQVQDSGGVGIGITTNIGGAVIANNTVVNGSFAGIDLGDASGTVRDNTVREIRGTGIIVSNGAIRAANNTVVDSDADGIRLDGFTARSTLRNTTARANAGAGIAVVEDRAGGSAPENTTITGGVLSDNRDGIVVSGASNTTVTGAAVRDNRRDGLRVTNGSGVNVTGGRFEANTNGVNVTRTARGESVRVRGATIANNSAFGIRSGDRSFVNATGNYWGSPDGPGSAPATDPDAPFRDFVTGTLADGSGDTVSEFPFFAPADFSGESNVLFDPFLPAAPAAGPSQPPQPAPAFTRDGIAQAKYGLDFAALSPETSRAVEEIFLRQPFAGPGPAAVSTRDELAQRHFGHEFEALADRHRRLRIQNEFDAQFGDAGTDARFTRDGIARAKYGLDFAALNPETTGQVAELYNRQPFDSDPGAVRTREEIARDRFGLPVDALSRESGLTVERLYHAQFARDDPAATDASPTPDADRGD